MVEPSPYRLFIRRFNQAEIRYVLTGSVASMVYGEMRYTNDVDLVAHIRPDQLDILAAVFPEEEFYLPPPEVIRIEISRENRGHFNIIHHKTGFKADVYLAGKDPLQLSALENARVISVEEDPVRLAPPEYIIVWKLHFFKEGGSEKHLRDIESMFRGQGERIDIAELERMIAERGLQSEWERIER